MTPLEIDEYINTYRTLEELKFPNHKANPYAALVGILSVMIAWHSTPEDTQKMIDKYITEMKQELAELSVSA